jgi:RNA polymerase sigma-70 factor, ECF subfamily
MRFRALSEPSNLPAYNSLASGLGSNLGSSNNLSVPIRPPELIYYGSPRHIGTEGRPSSQGTSPLAPRYGLDLQSFDEEYVRDLTEGKPTTERHFTAYFGNLILIKLRSRRLPAHVIEDIRQETFLRVFVTLRRKQGLEHPERLGAFVNSVCNNVFLEYLRSRSEVSVDDQSGNAPDPADTRQDAEATLVSEEHRKVVEQVLAELPRKDQKILRTVLLDERDKAEICEDLHVSRENLRVLLHRAKLRFRDILRRKYPDGDWMPALRSDEGKDQPGHRQRGLGAS